ncbi:hypothetical protein Tco_1394058 [Tanacetum coccineum]
MIGKIITTSTSSPRRLARSFSRRAFSPLGVREGRSVAAPPLGFEQVPISSDILTPLFHIRSLELLDISYNYSEGQIPEDDGFGAFGSNHCRNYLMMDHVKVKRCAEMSRKRYFFKDHISKDGLLSSGVPTVQPDVDLEALEFDTFQQGLSARRRNKILSEKGKMSLRRLLECYLGFRVAKVLVQLQNKVASYALSRVLKVAEALGSIANEPVIVEGEISYNVHKLNESKTADGYERRLWQKANLEYVKKSSIIKQDTSTLRNLQFGLNKLRYWRSC